MGSYPIPDGEEQRLEELRAYDILDTAPEQAYDDLCRLASHICGTEIAAISLIDEERQWFKSTVGLDDDETRREHAFCAHAIVEPGEMLVVEDATKDERFRDNPFVEDDPNIRFYAGAPLKTPDGRGLGTICAIDDEPRKLTDEQERALRALSRQVMTQLELRRRSRALREAKAELEEMTEELRRSNEELGRFASIISHELKDPLAQVVSNLDLLDLTTGDELGEEPSELLEDAIKGGDRMEALIQDLRRYARAGHDEADQQPVDLHEAMEEVESELDRRLEASDAELTVESLPSVTGDAALLRQVLQNLIGNAIKYSGDAPPRIHVGCDDQGHAWRIVLEDEGIGIPPEEQEHIFDVFERASNAGSRQGTGLGLALCERIVGLHGGRIGLESQPGEGSTFWFTLPKADDTEAADRHANR